VPTTHSPDIHRTADRSVGLAARPIRSGVYLTDEAFLYRVVGVVPSAAGEMVEIEDCFHLDVVQVPLAHVRTRRLRVVTPAPARA
jgi:hypothetical protein